MSELTEDDYMFIPETEAVQPTQGGYFQHFTDSWWLVKPGRGLAFYNPKNPRTGRRRSHKYGSPQCNAIEAISRKVAQDCAPWPDPEVRHFPSVWVPIDISDFRD